MCCDFSSAVPPDVVALDGDRIIVGIEVMTAAIHFRIDNAAPPVAVSDIRWIFSTNFEDTPFEGNNTDITNINNLLGGSIATFDTTGLSVTISNITQLVEGRYFFVATNPAGVQYNHTDLIVHGMCV